MPRRIIDRADFEACLAAPRFLLFKHSTTCPISARAFREYEAFAAAHPKADTAWLHVVDERPLSREVEARTGIAHESPQALLLEHGRVLWHASHGAITRASLAQSVAADSTPGAAGRPVQRGGPASSAS